MNSDKKCLISIDLGTSSIRACLVNHALEILFQQKLPVDLETGANGKAIQNAEEIVEIGIACIREVFHWANGAGYNPQALCFSNANASLVCLDSQFKPIQPAMTYLDLRAHQEADQLIEDYGPSFFTSTATPMHASYWLPKFCWMHNNDINLSRCQKFCTIKDLLIYRLTGQLVMDYSNAVATGMCNIKTGGWDEQLLGIAGIRLNQMPDIASTTQVLELRNHFVLPEANQQKGLKIVLGAMDGVLSSLGAGAYKPGQVTTMIGSSGACRIAASSPLINHEAMKIWSYPLDEEIWIRGGAMNNGGVVTQWLVENFSKNRTMDEMAYSDMFQSAARAPAGADGLIFLPYLYGERAPIYDENARGVYFGIQSNHTHGHFSRAGLEGILFALYSIFEIIQFTGDEIEVRATGGYLRSELMLQIQADIFGLPIHAPAVYEGSSIGAAVLGLKGLGIIKSYDEISDLIKIKKRYYPNSKNAAVYRKSFAKFKAIYEHLQPLFNGLP